MKTLLHPIDHLIENNQRLEDIKRFGTQAMSYSALQEGIKAFRHPHFQGFIAYSTVWGVDYVLSDPITAEEDRLKATILFLEKHAKAVFCQISRQYATLLSFLKFRINGFGIENIIRLPDFTVKWNNRKCLKSYISKLCKQGYFVFEYEADPNEVLAINEEWLNKKQNKKELRFMARPFIGTGDKNVRYFYLVQNKRLIGFCTFDPIYLKDRGGKVESYTLQHLRVANDALLGSQDFLILNALFQFKEEKMEKVSLGLAPLYQRNNDKCVFSSFAEQVFKIIYKFNLFYNYRTIGEHKDHYKAHKEQTFIAAKEYFSVRQLCGLLKVNNLI